VTACCWERRALEGGVFYNAYPYAQHPAVAPRRCGDYVV
jgi:hypothetical protein